MAKFLAKLDITDSRCIEALSVAKQRRKMATLIELALVHFLRTEDGKRTLNMLKGGQAVSNASPAEAILEEKPAEKPAKTVTVGGFFDMKKPSPEE